MSERQFVILLHGMGRSRFSMLPISSTLKGRGFRVINLDYPSTRKSVEQLASEDLLPTVKQCEAQGAGRIHFVTHSLGGIIVREMLQRHSVPDGSRVVMLSPPNKGSEVTDRLRNTLWYRWALGPAGQQLGTDRHSIPNQLQPIETEIGVITGRRNIDPWFTSFFRGENDGKVAVERTRLDEMTDFLVVDSGHTFIMLNPEVIEQVYHFLCHGQFFRTHPS